MNYLSFLQVEVQENLIAIYTLLGDSATDPCFSRGIVGVRSKPTSPTKSRVSVLAMSSFANHGKKKRGPTCQRQKHQSSRGVEMLSARTNVSLAEYGGLKL